MMKAVSAVALMLLALTGAYLAIDGASTAPANALQQIYLGMRFGSGLIILAIVNGTVFLNAKPI